MLEPSWVLDKDGGILCVHFKNRWGVIEAGCNNKQIRFSLRFVAPPDLAALGFNLDEKSPDQSFIITPIPPDYELVSRYEDDYVKGLKFRVKDMTQQGSDFIMS